MASSALQIHCAMICPIPAHELCSAMANGIVRKLGVLHVTQFVMAGAHGNAPTAAMHRQPYRFTYASGGSRPAVSQPMPPTAEAAVMWRPRALKRSAE